MSEFWEDFRQHNRKSLSLLGVLLLLAFALLVNGAFVIAAGTGRSLWLLALLALAIGLTSARHTIGFPGTRTSVTVPEIFTFFAVMALSPYHGSLLAAVDTVLACKRLRVRPALSLFNVANVTVSTFVAGSIYLRVAAYFSASPLSEAMGQKALAFAVPIVALATTHYLINIGVVALMSQLMKRTRIRDTVRDTFMLESATFVAAATVAGVVNYCSEHYGPLATVVAILLVVPVPVIIYYTFKNYHDKLGEQERHYHEMSEINDSILQMLAMAIDAKDQTTHEHIQRVRLFASRMGQMVGLSDPEIDALKAGALLHDIGKLGVPAYILNKPGKLTEHEFEQMKVHTIIGADMLSNINFRYPVVPIVRHHHERWDGKGYPDGLKGDEIPITARILTLVDNYDALRSDRPYHRGLTQGETLEYIGLNAGTYFDPKLVETFLSVVDQLEVEAAALTSSLESERHPQSPPGKSGRNEARGLVSAKPAAGFASTLPKNRAAAALNSIAETNQRVSAIWEMSRTLAGSLSLEDTVAILVNRLSKMIPFTTCAISLFDASKSEFEYAHASGRDAEKFLRRRLPVSAGITGWVIQHQRPMYNTNPVLDLSFLGHEPSMQYKTAMVFPLVKNQESLGAIALYSAELENYPSQFILIMEAVSQPASDSIFNALSQEKARQAIFSDTETGLANMRAFAARFAKEQARSRRLAAPLSIVLVRADDPVSAAIKEGCGTEKLLTALADILKQRVPDDNLVARHSGDTFVLLLPEKGLAETAELATRISESVASSPYAPSLAVTIGSATYPDHGNNLEDLLRSAQLNRSSEGQSTKATAVTLDSFLH